MKKETALISRLKSNKKYKRREPTLTLSGCRGSFQRKEGSELDWNPGRRNRTFSSCPLARAQRRSRTPPLRQVNHAHLPLE
jgi:hypothetical protein